MRRRLVAPADRSVAFSGSQGNPTVNPQIDADAASRGLTSEEVAERVARGQVNVVATRGSRSVWDIVRANVFNRLNAILSVLLLIVLWAGSPVDAMFGLVIVANSGVGILQESRAKRTLDKLVILNQARPLVRRDGVAAAIPPQQLVLDDVIELGPGDQLAVDGTIVESQGLMLDESLLTGEADPIGKEPGATALSGSFVSSGSGAYRATRVGTEAYAARLAEQASRFTLVHSDLRANIDRVLTFITWIIVPAGLLIIYNQLFASGEALRPALIGMVGALVPMIPQGLVLMTSVALAVGVIRLGRRQCLVQELPAIEALARVDVLCVDKTGTLTESGMRLAELRPVAGADLAAARGALATIAGNDPRPNPTIAALRDGLGATAGWGEPDAVAPFSSTRKWQGLSFAAQGNWYLGAPDVLLDPASETARAAEALGARGLRVLLLGRSATPVDDPAAPGDVVPQMLLVLEQRIRPDARATLDYFASQQVSVKIISGDNALSVGAVASALGMENGGNPLDARDLPDEGGELGAALAASSTIGRVRPEQKRAMIHALQAQGHVVAMIGDGVNDVLALKDADVGVAMASGSPASRAVSQIVLLDNRFATLPHVVAEGRRVVGNIERVANLFLTKTVYSAILALMFGLSGVLAPLLGLDPVPFPFLPRHATLAAWFSIGIPAFVLSLAPSSERARPGFVGRVMRLALPSGLVIALATFAAHALAGGGAGAAAAAQASTAALITLIIVMLRVLAVVARPYEWWKVLLLAGCGLGYLVVFALPATRQLFALDVSNAGAIGIALAFGAAGMVLIELGWWLTGALYGEPRRLFARR